MRPLCLHHQGCSLWRGDAGFSAVHYRQMWAFFSVHNTRRRVFDARVAGQLYESQKDGHRETVRGQSIHVPTYIKRVSVPFASPHLAAVVVIPVEVSYTHSRISTTTDRPTDRHEASLFSLFFFFPPWPFRPRPIAVTRLPVTQLTTDKLWPDTDTQALALRPSFISFAVARHSVLGAA